MTATHEELVVLEYKYRYSRSPPCSKLYFFKKTLLYSTIIILLICLITKLVKKIPGPKITVDLQNSKAKNYVKNSFIIKPKIGSNTPT